MTQDRHWQLPRTRSGHRRHNHHQPSQWPQSGRKSSMSTPLLVRLSSKGTTSRGKRTKNRKNCKNCKVAKKHRNYCKWCPMSHLGKIRAKISVGSFLQICECSEDQVNSVQGEAFIVYCLLLIVADMWMRWGRSQQFTRRSEQSCLSFAQSLVFLLAPAR